MKIASRVLTGIIAGGFVAAIAACFESEDPDFVLGGDPFADAGPGTSSGAPGAAGSPGSPGSPGGNLRYGGALNLNSANGSSSFIAAFATTATSVESLGCTEMAYGGCTLKTCPKRDASVATTGAVPVSAGTITATGGNIASQGITLTPQSDKSYPPFSGIGSYWVGGETITFNASGADIASFNVTAVAPPANLNITRPVVMSGSTVNIPRTADYVFQWSTTATVGDLFITLSTDPGTGATVKLATCTFPVSAKSGTATSTFLSALTAGPGVLTFGVASTSEVVASDTLVSMQLSSPARANGVEVSFVSLNITN